MPDRTGRADVRRAQASRVRGRIRSLSGRGARHVAGWTTLASRRFSAAAAGLVHLPPAMTTLASSSVAGALAEFIATPLDAALAGAEDEGAAQANALQLFHSVARDVPAYRSFLAEHGIQPGTI